ncbi:formylglycine-generating enzyme family protein [Cupriavidus taiwanensis]|uniref:formylglycine-generating enzyme family protein n=1 Tax=Cupriavidus taiwanensis TaxID=164546 RepID=UPI0018DB76DD|nr:SUMF1/EgtB/PvdO family nonheme iron enzyme [Cupriavidus taiwanensis]
MQHARRFGTYPLIASVLAFFAPSSWALQLDQDVQALVNKSKANLIFIKGGTFKMGDFGAITTQDKLPYTTQDESKPLHDVELDSFSIGKYKVTYEDFDVYSKATNTQKIGELKANREYRTIANVPAGVNWQEAKNYCLWLRKISSLPFDLPTEAQWEYAARSGGKFHPWATDNGQYEEGRNVANYDQREKMMPKIASPLVYPVGKYPPNPIGLYDMSSNGTDWVNDWFSATYYEESPRRNPTGPTSGTEKVKRGIELDYATALTMYRQKSKPAKEISYLDRTPISDRHPESGFRCVVNSPKPINVK